MAYADKLKSLLEDLDNITPINLFSETTTIEEAVAWAKKIMKALNRDDDFMIKEEDMLVVSEKLKELGALNFSQLKINRFYKGDYIGALLGKKNDISFPLSAFAQLVDTSYSTFRYGFNKAFLGGKHSWASEWLDTQRENGGINRE